MPGASDDYRFVGRRRRLIEDIRDRGIDDLDLLQLFDKTPRHLFIPEGMWHRAYEDAPVPIGYGQTASQPSLQALYLQILEPGADDRVLEIGTGSGYLTALLARVAERVYSIERVRELSVRARRALDDLEIRNVALMVGDGSIGWRKFSPFDIIVVSAASPSIPDTLVEQLAEGGRMLIPVGSREEQELTLVGKEGSGRTEKVIVESVQDRCTFVPLLGRYGWATEDER
ncbi:MAG: protein-L-isoaspartate(D-aspartate) O-methyltransferase [Longimicrobiales bacterium]|nr:protein-L-isoaspartate(D-aspartate) O-methyltransferase [Longimicrobiales bacterium]